MLSGVLAAVAAGAATDDTAGLAAYFPFDGSAGEASGVKIFGQLVTAGGVAADSNPEYVDGRFGSAIRFSGNTALRIPLDLHPDAYPQLTITAWVFLEDVGDESDAILSTGEGDGVALWRSGRAFEAQAGADRLGAQNALSPSRWSFIAGVWDYESGVVRLHWRTRSVEGAIEGEALAPPEPDVWLGAMNDSLSETADNLRIDELRIYARALEPDEIAAVRDSEALKGRLTSTAGSSATKPPFVRPSGRPQISLPKSNDPLRRSSGQRRGAAESPEPDQEELPETTDAPSLPPVVVRPIPKAPVVLRPAIGGASQLSGVTGRTAEIVRRVDFEDRAIDSLQWSEKLDKPCEIEVIDRDAERRSMVARINHCSNRGFACEDVPCLTDSVEYYSDEAVRLSPNQAVTAVQVCLNSGGGRVKGIEIRGGQILGDGKIDPVGGVDRDHTANCRDWGTLVFCPSRHVATGLLAHFKKGKAPTASIDALTGLQLICRKVELKPIN